MSRLVQVLLFMSAVCVVRAENLGAIDGTVRDSLQAVIPEARIALLARDNTVARTVTADAQGQYHVDQLLPGTYLVQAEAQGFAKSVIEAAHVERGTRAKLDFRLQVAGLQTTVVVTASASPQTTDEISKSVSVVDGETIELHGERFVTEALAELPGVRVQTLGGPGSITSIRIRGLRNEDTAVLLDGFRMRDLTATQGDASGLLQDLTVTDVDRVEVLRGAGSSLYGTNATGGVIQVITGEGGGRTRGSLLAEGGSLGAFRGRGLLSGSARQNALRYSAGLSHLNVTSGVDGDSPARTGSAQGRIDYSLAPGVRLFGRLFAADSFSMVHNSPEGTVNIPARGLVDAIGEGAGATFVPDLANPDSTRAARHFSGALSLNARISEKLGFTASYQGLRTRRRYGDGPAGPGFQPVGSSIWHYDGDLHTADARVYWTPEPHQTIDVGYEFESESYDQRTLQPNPAESSVVAAHQRSHAAYAQDQVRLLDGRLQLAGSFRVQFFALNHPAFTPESNAPYPMRTFPSPEAARTGDGSAAYFFRSTGTKIRAHAGRGYRAPSLYERFGTYYTTFGYSAYGDPLLRPERSIGMDGGIDQTLWNSRARLSATYFYTRLETVILFDFTGAIDPVSDPYGRAGGYRNTNGAMARGAELSAELAPTRSLTLNAAYTYTNARERSPLADGNLRTYAIPGHQFAVSAVERLSARLSMYFRLRCWSNYIYPIYDPVSYSSRAYRFGAQQQAQLGASYRVPLDESRALRFYAHASNVFDQPYFESGYRMPGATARGGMQFEF